MGGSKDGSLISTRVATVLAYFVRAERKPLEEISPPLSAEDAGA